jgi:hypothetical protein
MNKTIFVKYSNERARQLAIKTTIFKDTETNEKFVEKRALHPEGARHIEVMFENYQTFLNMQDTTKFVPNKATKTENGVRFEYLNEMTLEEKFNQLASSGALEQLEQEFETLLAQIGQTATETNFETTPDFGNVFGEVEVPHDSAYATLTNIDMIPSNIFEKGDVWTVIDYEWSFRFPVPVKFVQYRAAHYYFGVTTIEGLKPLYKNLLEKFNISERDVQLFEQMEANFQKRVMFNHDGSKRTAIRDLHGAISPGAVVSSFDYAVANQLYSQYVTIFESEGGAFAADNMQRLPRQIRRDNEYTFTVKPETNHLRIDLSETSFAAKVRLETMDGTRIECVSSNHTYKNDEVVVFFTNDPQLAYDITNVEAREFRLIFTIVPVATVFNSPEFGTIRDEMELDRTNQFQTTQGEISALQDEVSQLKAELEQIKSSKVWKSYAKLRNGLHMK